MSEASRHRLGCEAQFAQRLKHHCTLVTALRVAPGERRPAVSPHSKEVRYSDQPRRALTLSASVRDRVAFYINLFCAISF